MRGGAREIENISVIISGGGKIYTVDEVSDLLGIPRPTLYRYLREYSIPHLRRGGRISIPEESFDRIRRARDLHREGLGTASVRRALREESETPDTMEIEQRLDRLSAMLEDLKGSMRERRPATGDQFSSHSLRTIMARQSLLMSAVFNLTEMVEELLLASGKSRKPTLDLGDAPPVVHKRGIAAGYEPDAIAPPPRSLPAPAGPGRFGTMRRRRRRGVLAVLCTVLLAGMLAWVLASFGGEPPTAHLSLEREIPEAAVRQPAHKSERPPEEVRTPETKPPRQEIPDVSGKSMREATRLLKEAGYAVETIRLVPGEAPAGTVISTEPEPGSAAKVGVPVVIVVSTGPDSSARMDEHARGD